MTGVPVFRPEHERLDGLALFTKAGRSVGLIATASLLRRLLFAINHT